MKTIRFGKRKLFCRFTGILLATILVITGVGNGAFQSFAAAAQEA